jgi:hypothetical protein
MITNKSVLPWVLSLVAAVSMKAATVSTGDLGLNIINAGGAYEWSPTVTSPTNGLPAQLAVTYGLWNDPDTTVHAFVNGTEVGTFLVNNPFFNGTATSTFDFTNLLVDGVNTVRLDGLGASEGDYVISSIELNYNLPLPPIVVTNPPPSTNEPVSGPFVRNGTSVLHYLNRTPLADKMGENISGSVRLQLNEQGDSSLQKLDLNATALRPNEAYILIAARGDDPNAYPIGTVTTDKHGRVRVSFTKGNGEGGESLPAELDPVTDIHGIGLAESANTQSVAWSVINTSSNFQYLVERNLTQQDANATPEGSITLEANTSSVNFHLLADGLSPGGTYSLALNSVVVATTTTDAHGALEFTTWPASAPAVLDLRSLSLLDSSNNVLLSTVLPK